jgi:hypothetical protein
MDCCVGFYFSSSRGWERYMYEVYVLKDPNTLKIRYVGYTGSPDRRRRGHRCPGETDAKDLKKWKIDLRRTDQEAIYEVVEILDNKEEAKIFEENIIERLVEEGYNLLNRIGNSKKKLEFKLQVVEKKLRSSL